jgi:hypothetical protein
MRLEQFAYLVIRAGAYGLPRRKDGPVEGGMKAASSALAIQAWTSSVENRRGDGIIGNSRMFFAFKDRRADDLTAHRIAESVLLVFELFNGPLLMAPEIENILRLPFGACSPRSKTLIAEDLANAALAKNTTELWPNVLSSEISTCSFVSDRGFGLAWALTPKVFEFEWLHDALAFYSASIRRFYVWDVDIPNFLENDTKLGAKRAELALAEGAFHDAYKSIEAVVGDPGNFGDRFLTRLAARGVRHDELIGFENKRSVLEVIRGLSEIRDKRSAHGGTPKRGISILEVSECQRCAEFIIQSSVDHLSGGALIDRWSNWYNTPARGTPKGKHSRTTRRDQKGN